MGAIDEFASDVNGIIADLNAQFRVLSDQKNALKSQGNDIAAQWADYFSVQKAAMLAAQDALNRISNVPISEVAPSKPANGGPLSSLPLLKP